MGGYLRENAIQPDLVLCSPAVRTRQTLELLIPEEAGSAGWGEVKYVEALYRQSAGNYLDILHRLNEPGVLVLIVGHNPATQDTALMLTPADSPHLPQLRRKYPTGALSLFESNEAVNSMKPGNTRLTEFVAPRSLAHD